MAVVINEIYTGAGSTDGLYTSDYIELYNNSNQSFDLSQYSLQYAASSSSTWRSVNLTGSIPANGYYLVAAPNGTGQSPLPVTPDASFSTVTNLSSSGGKVALVSSTTILQGSNPQGLNSGIVDFVGYGSANASEGSPAPVANSRSDSTMRTQGIDTNNNANDFVTGAANPQNTFSPPNDYSVCFVSGTRILTQRGQCAVEHLVVGDLVVTASGEARPVRWLGHRAMVCRGRKDAMPVRIAADAFGVGRPVRDLLVSPAHAICVDVLGEVLIPAVRLVNGTTIAQVEADEVTYWHVELDSHDILLAEGLPAESYLDCGNRRFFADADATDLLAAPDARPEGLLPFCRRFHEEGPLVDLVRARLQERAEARGWHKIEEAFAGLHLVADGRTIRPDVQGLTARFVVPAEARDVRLVSATSVPAHVVPGSSDDRRLGVALAALTIDDGLTGARSIALDDARLGEGFQAINTGARWTDGSAALPATLWDGCKGSFFLWVRLAGPALPRWIAPGAMAGVVNLADRRQA